MNQKTFALFAVFSLNLFLTSKVVAAGPPQLLVTYGNTGVQQVAFNGVVLENTLQNSADTFHIWHMKATDLSGNVLTGGQYDWGEANSGKSWNASTQTWTYKFVWGSIAVQFSQSGLSLNMGVTVVNDSNSGIIFDGANIYPFVLNFPALPVGFKDPTYDQLAFNTTGPSVTLADYGQGEVAAIYPNATKPLYSGFQPAGTTDSYTPIISGTALDGMPSFFPSNDRPILPGQSDSYTVSLRFALSGTPADWLATDAYQAWAKAYPVKLNGAEYEKINQQRVWCQMAEVSATPMVLINGYRLPDLYQLNDLKYMLD